MQLKVILAPKFVWLLFAVSPTLLSFSSGSAQNTDERRRALTSAAALHSHSLL